MMRRQERCSMRLCHRTVLKLSLTAGGTRVSAFGGRPNAAPQGPCPLPSGARLTGIESRDDDPPPHGHAAWRGHGVRARRFPRKTQARASIGNADRASSGGRGSNASRSGAFGRRSRTKAQASRPWIHGTLSLLSPFVRLLRRLTTAARPCGTRAAFAATSVAARAGKARSPHHF